MIDKGMFIGMNGAQSQMNKLEVLTNNLANVITVGFRADYEVEKPVETHDDALAQEFIRKFLKPTLTSNQVLRLTLGVN